MTRRLLIGIGLTALLLVRSGLSLAQPRQAFEMYLEIGTLSEIVLPESYATVQIPVQIVELRDVPGRNKTVITLHPVISDRSKTNIRIYSQNHDFNIKLMINWPGASATETLDIAAHFPDAAKKKAAALTASGLTGKNIASSGAPGIGRNGYDLPTDRLVTQADFTLEKLVQIYPNLLKPNKRAPGIVKNRMVLGFDYIFHHAGKLVFKATLWNKSSVPYNILHLSIIYKEKSGVPIISRRESKSLTLTPYYESFSKKIVHPGEKSHLIYVTSKLSPQDTGFFNCLVVEKNGARTFDFNIPAYLR